MFKSRDTIWTKQIAKSALEPTWKEPYTMILCIPEAVEVSGITIHHTQVKKAEAMDAAKWTVSRTVDPINKISSGSCHLPLSTPLPPPESYAWHEYRVMVQPPLPSGLDLETEEDRHREVLLRNLFILQVVRLVLTYNFSNCNFKEISKIYSEAIFPDLDEYLNGSTFDQIEVCDDLTDCLMKIEYHTLNPIPGCPSLPQKIFALKTKEALISQCPGYSETQRNNPQEMKQEVENICMNQTSQIQWLWFTLRQTL
ncbi:thymic stromal lymphopoietin [Peromyscus eremicus]|uniref:thymic stromal lymphopoietin n=1 Tax=Peromyscus eremicus TaxID=42410 RepID=UPI0027DE7DC5|nr:thymic stromal lymphopoietin [Peromyscus eremicus]